MGRPPAGVAAHSILPLPPPVPGGPVSEQLQKISGKLVDHMRLTLEDVFWEMSAQGSAEAQVKTLQLDLEKMQWRFTHELTESTRNSDLVLAEVRASIEAEKQKAI